MIKNDKNGYHQLLKMMEKLFISDDNTTDIQKKINHMLEEIGKIFSCQRIYIYKKNLDGSFEIWAQWHPDHVQPAVKTCPLEAAEVIETMWKQYSDDDRIEIDDIEKLKGKEPFLYNQLKAFGVKTGQFAIFRENGEVRGIAGVENPSWNDKTAMFAVLHICMEVAKRGMHTDEALLQAETTSTHDSLTGLGNRNALASSLKEMRHDTSIGILFADLNGLKETNDKYGHDQGDLLLKKTASVLTEAFGENAVYRLGGDEFLVVVNSISKDAFSQQIEKMNGLLKENNITLASGNVFEQPWKTNFELLMRMADTRMYEIKRQWYSDQETADISHQKDEDLELILEIYVNQGLYQVLYKNNDDLVNPASFGYLKDLIESAASHNVYPEDRASFQSFCNPDLLKKRALENDTGSMEMQLEFRISTPDGKWNWMRLSMIVSNSLDDDFRLLCIVRNLSRRDKIAIRHREELLSKTTDGEDLQRDDDILKKINIWMADTAGRKALLFFRIKRYPLYQAIFGHEEGRHYLLNFNTDLTAFVNQHQGIYGYCGDGRFAASVVFQDDQDKLKEETADWIRSLSTAPGFETSCGIAVYEEGTSIADLYDQARLCEDEIYSARNTFVKVFSKDNFSRLRDEQHLMHDIREAMKNGEMTFYLQPKVNMENGKVVSSEALVRWIHNGQVIPPADFIPLLEREERIYALDRYVWEGVFAFQRKLLDQGMKPLPISVNVSQKDIKAGNIVNDFVTLKNKYHMDQSLVDIEITESAFAGDEQVHALSTKLSDAGFRILMDDFGKGYSSLSIFSNMPVDILKIDKRFMDKLMNDKKDEEIVALIVKMAHMVGVHVVVEGVETQEQVRKMLSMNCHYAQGYYFYQPMNQEDYIKLLSDQDKIQYDPNASGRLSVGYLDFGELVRSGVLADEEINGVTGALSIWQILDHHPVLLQMNQAYSDMIGFDFTKITPDQNMTGYMAIQLSEALTAFQTARNKGHMHTGSWYLRPDTRERVYLQADIYPLNKRLNGDLYLVQMHCNKQKMDD